MTEEEYFRKNYPDSCYGDRLLSPHWDFFQDGVEFGERQSEKKIEELEQEIKVLEQNLEDTEIVNKALEEENAELKGELKKWKDEWQEQVQKATDEGYARTLQTMQLTKAKELLKEFVQHYKAKTIYVEKMQDLLEQAEQFLKDKTEQIDTMLGDKGE